MRLSTYVAALVRDHVGGVAPIPEPELLALKQALAHLSATGRLLQDGIARRAVDPDRASALARDIESLRTAVAALVRRNAQSWAADA